MLVGTTLSLDVVGPDNAAKHILPGSSPEKVTTHAFDDKGCHSAASVTSTAAFAERLWVLLTSPPPEALPLLCYSFPEARPLVRAGGQGTKRDGVLQRRFARGFLALRALRYRGFSDDNHEKCHPSPAARGPQAMLHAGGPA